MPVSGGRRQRGLVWTVAITTLMPSAAWADGGRPARAPAVEIAPAARPESKAEARRQFMVGERLFRAGRYREAARAYERGYLLSGRPGFLINIAHCQVRLGRLDLAREQYRRFLAEAPDATHAADVARALADIDAQLAARGSRTDADQDLPAGRPGASFPVAFDTPPMPLGSRDRLHQPSPAEAALRLPAAGAPPARPPRWLWPVVGVVAAAFVTGTVAVLAGRDQRGPLSRGSIGTIRQ